MKVLVTGGAGFIGSQVVDALIARGDSVGVVDNLSSGSRRNLNPRARLYVVDITDPAAVEAVFAQEKPEAVSHHAAQTDVRRSLADVPFDARTNILGSIHVLDGCVKQGAKNIVFASTSAIYPETQALPIPETHPLQPVSAYGVSKMTVENYLALYKLAFGLRWTAFRYGNVYGPRQDPHGECGVVAIFSGQLLAGATPTIFGDGTKTRDYIHVDDIVRGNLLALDGAGDGEVFNLGMGREVSDYEVFQGVAAALGSPVMPIFGKKRPGELDRVCLDITKAQRVLGWSPRVTLAEGMAATVAYYKKGAAQSGAKG
ncbi:MAG: NAD-dependent epimerase/dehydratase family protein [Dehalococcoidia bacterium]|nr:NAD-dependent epimerase/dehydratase family protein [Dehalococcoidia bacterium]